MAEEAAWGFPGQFAYLTIFDKHAKFAISENEVLSEKIGAKTIKTYRKHEFWHDFQYSIFL